MKIVVLGATGRTGQLLVQKALATGHEVTAAARRPENVRASGSRLRRQPCDVCDATSVAQAVADQDCILVAIAPHRAIGPTTLFSTAIKNVLAAGRGIPPQRILVLGSCGVDGATRTRLPTRLFASLIVQPLLFGLYVDTARMEGILETSPSIWTVVRPPRLTNGREIGAYRLGFGQHLPNVASIARADVAAAMLQLIDEPAAYRTWVEVASDAWM